MNCAGDGDVFNVCIADNTKQTSVNVGSVKAIIGVDVSYFGIGAVAEVTCNMSAEGSVN